MILVRHALTDFVRPWQDASAVAEWYAATASEVMRDLMSISSRARRPTRLSSIERHVVLVASPGTDSVMPSQPGKSPAWHDHC